MPNKIRMLVADDHPIYRDGLVRSLTEDARFDVIATAGTADEAVSEAKRVTPDLVLLDISMPGGGINAARQIAEALPGIKMAMLTVSEDDKDVMEALKAGAQGYLLKGVSASELTGLLADIAAGQSHISPNLAMRILRTMQDEPPETPKSGLNDLTKREEDILRRVAEGLSNREVADALGLQEKTVKHYMTAILQKLQVRNRVEAALIAREHWSPKG